MTIARQNQRGFNRPIFMGRKTGEAKLGFIPALNYGSWPDTKRSHFCRIGETFYTGHSDGRWTKGWSVD